MYKNAPNLYPNIFTKVEILKKQAGKENPNFFYIILIKNKINFNYKILWNIINFFL